MTSERAAPIIGIRYRAFCW